MKLNQRLAEVMEQADIPEPTEELTFPSLDRRDLSETWYPNDHDLDEVYKLAITGVSDDTIAVIGCNVSPATFKVLLQEQPQLQQTIQKGRMMGNVLAARVVVNEMLDKNSRARVTTAQFYLKQRENWVKATGVNLPEAPSSKEIGKMSDDELLKKLSRNTLRSLKEPNKSPDLHVDLALSEARDVPYVPVDTSGDD